MDQYYQYWPVAVGSLAVLGALYLLVRILLHKPQPKISDELQKERLTSNEKFNCLIEDEDCGTIHAYIDFGKWAPSVDIGGEMRPVRDWYYYGEMVYWLESKKKSPFTDTPPTSIVEFLQGMFTPIEPPLELGNMPSTLWQVLHEAYKFINVEFEMEPPAWLGSMMKYAVIALVIGALIFIVAKGKG
jgi:hypothetical protein